MDLYYLFACVCVSFDSIGLVLLHVFEYKDKFAISEEKPLFLQILNSKSQGVPCVVCNSNISEMLLTRVY